MNFIIILLELLSEDATYAASKREAWKETGLSGFEPRPLRYRQVRRSNQLG